LSAKFLCARAQRQEAAILVQFGTARQLYNACLGGLVRRLNLMRQSNTYQSARYIPKDEEHKKERSEEFGEARKQVAFSDAYTKKAGEKLGWMGLTIQLDGGKRSVWHSVPWKTTFQK
jgi:hypothetical protein